MRRQGLVLSQRLKAYCDPCSWISNETLARDVVGVWSSRGWRGSETNRETLDSTVAEGAFHRCALIDRTGILLILPDLFTESSFLLSGFAPFVGFISCVYVRERGADRQRKDTWDYGGNKNHMHEACLWNYLRGEWVRTRVTRIHNTVTAPACLTSICICVLIRCLILQHGKRWEMCIKY